jgi:signal transduction histidine kinase
MSRKAFILLACLLLSTPLVRAQETQKSELHQKAEAIDQNKEIAKARSTFIHAFNDYANKGQVKPGVECAVKATALYYKENFYQEAFDLLRRADQTIVASKLDAAGKAALHYLTTKERMQMYIKMRRSPSALEQLGRLEAFANQSGDEHIKDDLLYNKAIYYYTFGLTAQGNAVFKQMADKLTKQKEYGKVDEVYKTLIENGRKSGNANMVAQSYSNYIAWKDSANAQKVADEIGALKEQIATQQATIADKDSSLSTRWATIIGLGILALALAAALAIGAVVLLRYIVLSRKQKNVIQLANESNALKAKFISNISTQMAPTLQKLDNHLPEVRALQQFTDHIQTLSEIENTADDAVEKEDTQIQPFCEELIGQIRGKVKKGVTLTVDAPKMSVKLNKEYVTHIVSHLLGNAAEFTPEGGTIKLTFKKRGPHTNQIMVTDTGSGIPEDQREDIFKPFLKVHDLAKGDGLGLPICKQMALKMKGDLTVDPEYSKGTRFILELR